MVKKIKTTEKFKKLIRLKNTNLDKENQLKKYQKLTQYKTILKTSKSIKWVC